MKLSLLFYFIDAIHKSTFSKKIHAPYENLGNVVNWKKNNVKKLHTFPGYL